MNIQITCGINPAKGALPDGLSSEPVAAAWLQKHCLLPNTYSLQLSLKDNMSVSVFTVSENVI